MSRRISEISSFDELLKELLGTNSFSYQDLCLEHFLQEQGERKFTPNDRQRLMLSAVYSENNLDLRYAMIHREQGNVEKAKELEAFVAAKANRPRWTI